MHIFIGGETPTEVYLDANAVLDVPAPNVNGLSLFHATKGEGYRRGGSRCGYWCLNRCGYWCLGRCGYWCLGRCGYWCLTGVSIGVRVGAACHVMVIGSEVITDLLWLNETWYCLEPLCRDWSMLFCRDWSMLFCRPLMVLHRLPLGDLDHQLNKMSCGRDIPVVSAVRVTVSPDAGLRLLAAICTEGGPCPGLLLKPETRVGVGVGVAVGVGVGRELL